MRQVGRTAQDKTASLLGALADKLDPENRSAAQLTTNKGVWVEPPDLVDWAHSNFVDPVTNDYIILIEHQQRILRTILRMIWNKQVITVVYSDCKKCLAVGEKVYLDDGKIVSCESLVGKTANVLSFDGGLKDRLSVSARFEDNGKRPCLKVTTYYGFEYIRTEEHPFLTVFGWKEAKDINPGDRLLVPLNLQNIGNKQIDRRYLKYLAYVLADGGASGSGWAKRDPNMVGEMRDIAESFGLTFHSRYNDGLNWRLTTGKRGGSPHRNPLVNFAKRVKYQGHLSGSKFVPDFVFALDDDSIALFLNRLFSGDGGMDGKEVHYYTTSLQLAKDVQYLLLRLGIVAKLRYKKNSKCRSGISCTVQITDRQQVRTFKNKIGFFHVDKARRLDKVVSLGKEERLFRSADYNVLDKKLWKTFDKIRHRLGKTMTELNGQRWNEFHAPTRERCSRIADGINSEWVKLLCDSSFGFDEVVSVEYVGELPTVSIETENHFFLTTAAEHNSGKTTIAGLIGAYWATFVEAPNEVVTVANDQEQSQGRIYAAMLPTMKRLGWNVPERMPIMENYTSGSKIRAIGTNFAGEAGANQGLTLWSELWAYVSESRKRLWEEMTPVPTRKYSIRWVETYAGFLGESELLWNLYCQAFKNGDETYPLGDQIEGLEDLPIQYIPTSKLIVYWNHDPKMPWQTEEYYAQQRADLRPAAFQRLHRNMWVSASDQFIDPVTWDSLEACDPLKEENDPRPIILAADASTSNDSTALVAAYWDTTRKAPDIVGAWYWVPTQTEDIVEKKKAIDLEILEKKIEELIEKHDVIAVYYDAYQLHSIMTKLKNKYDRMGLRKMFVNFPQSTGRVEADQSFYQHIMSKKMRSIHHTKLREHVLNAVAEESPRGYRLAKEKTSNKIDLAVAASMATYGSSVRSRPARTFVKV